MCDVGIDCKRTSSHSLETSPIAARPLTGAVAAQLARARRTPDGRAKNISEVIHCYKDRFNIDFSGGKQSDLQAFLGAL